MKSLKLFINESRGAALKDRTPDRFVKEKPANQIMQKQLEKWDDIVNDYVGDLWEYLSGDLIDSDTTQGGLDDNMAFIEYGINEQFPVAEFFYNYSDGYPDSEIKNLFLNLNSSQTRYLEKQFSLKVSLENKEAYFNIASPLFLEKYVKYIEKTGILKKIKNLKKDDIYYNDNVAGIRFPFSSTDELKKNCGTAIYAFADAWENMVNDILKELTR